jgi:hypothetical protein
MQTVLESGLSHCGIRIRTTRCFRGAKGDIRKIFRQCACPPFSHGIVAFNGWPLNALRGDNHYKKPVGKKSA